MSDFYHAVKTEKLEKVFYQEIVEFKQQTETLLQDNYGLRSTIQQMQSNEEILKVKNVQHENEILQLKTLNNE